MSDTVTLPLWLFFARARARAVGGARLAAAARRALVLPAQGEPRDPGDRVRLKVEIPQFKLTRRQVLIDRLFHDPQGAGGGGEGRPEKEHAARARALARVDRYAREIVPAFNAYLYFRIGYWLAQARWRSSLYRVRLGYTDSGGAGRGQSEIVRWCSS